MRWRRFVAADVAGAALWAAYATALGYLGGSTFRDTLWKPIAAAAAVAAVVAAVAEFWRRRVRSG